MFFIPSFTRACASTVAVVVPSPAISFVLVATSFTSWAPMFSYRSSSSISFAMVTPSLVISGVPKDLSKTTFLPFGPSVTFTVSASLLTPSSIFFLASISKLRSFAIFDSFSLFISVYIDFYDPTYSTMAIMSSWLTITYSSSSSFTSVPAYWE